jgi:hypothetical protein
MKSLRDYIKLVQEAPETGKITDLKPGQSATIQTGPGLTTTVDLKANPTALTKDDMGKLKLMTKPTPGAPPPTDKPEGPKAGDEIQIGEEDEITAESLSMLALARKLRGI